MSKFKKGDKVITIKNTPLRPEGWIGYITSGDGSFGYRAHENYGSEEYFLFEEHELGLLSPSVHIPNSVKDDITPQEIDGIHTSALDKQVSGNHYKDCGIQPIEYIHANGLNYFEGNAVKYITRHRKKNGKADLLKAIHYLELMIELEYPK